jgi:hypothetical protein
VKLTNGSIESSKIELDLKDVGNNSKFASVSFPHAHALFTEGNKVGKVRKVQEQWQWGALHKINVQSDECKHENP